MKYISIVICAVIARISQTQAVTSAPSPAALAYAYVGAGVCTDANNEEHSSFEISSTLTLAECSALCSSKFPLTELVGFGANTPTSCSCYFSGGALPSHTPADGLEYFAHGSAGNGPVASYLSRAGWECYVYAKGTGSPTTSGATHAPITPSPTGTITAAPTPSGIKYYTHVGSGFCTDLNSNQYDYFIHRYATTPSAADCAQHCGKFPSPDLLGFLVVNGTATKGCGCQYSNGAVPLLPATADLFKVNTELTGTGPIKGSLSASNYECYAFGQGTGAPSTSPTMIPTTQPPTTTSPTTESPTTAIPTTQSPTTAIPTTQSPTTTIPTKVPTLTVPSPPTPGSKSAKRTKTSKLV